MYDVSIIVNFFTSRRVFVGISKPATERLARLARFLEQRAEAGKSGFISSSELEQMTGWPSHTIRKDVSQLVSGFPEPQDGADMFSTSAGYDPVALASCIRRVLSLENASHNCCVVGLGRLGSSFLNYEAFAGTPFTLRAGFDSNVNRIEILQGEFPLYPTFRMKEVIPRFDIKLALLCVPGECAQASADKLFSCGVTGIVNFTSVVLSTPPGTAVENVSVLDALGALATRLAFNRLK